MDYKLLLEGLPILVFLCYVNSKMVKGMGKAYDEKHTFESGIKEGDILVSRRFGYEIEILKKRIITPKDIEIEIKVLFNNQKHLWTLTDIFENFELKK